MGQNRPTPRAHSAGGMGELAGGERQHGTVNRGHWWHQRVTGDSIEGRVVTGDDWRAAIDSKWRQSTVAARSSTLAAKRRRYRPS